MVQAVGNSIIFFLTRFDNITSHRKPLGTLVIISSTESCVANTSYKIHSSLLNVDTSLSTLIVAGHQCRMSAVTFPASKYSNIISPNPATSGRH